MDSTIEEISCLVVEDDSFKSDSVRGLLKEVLGEETDVVACEALSKATSMLSERMFDVAVIDMSIPSHPTRKGSGSPYSLPSGGLDVLFLISDLEHQSTTIILTQYPEIEIEGKLIPVDMAAKEIEAKFGINVAGCVQYFEDDPIWKEQVKKILEER